jgi:cysteine sulfinate desulfinase/cysteine desulfurase-like protein
MAQRASGLFISGRFPLAYGASPLLSGCGQERSLRPVTLNTALIVGMGAALELSFSDRQEDRSVSKVIFVDERIYGTD